MLVGEGLFCVSVVMTADIFYLVCFELLLFCLRCCRSISDYWEPDNLVHTLKKKGSFKFPRSYHSWPIPSPTLANILPGKTQ